MVVITESCHSGLEPESFSWLIAGGYDIGLRDCKSCRTGFFTQFMLAVALLANECVPQLFSKSYVRNIPVVDCSFYFNRWATCNLVIRVEYYESLIISFIYIVVFVIFKMVEKISYNF